MPWDKNSFNFKRGKRGVCFTLNNYTEGDVIEIRKWHERHGWYVLFGYEVGDVEGTPHLQGYVHMHDTKSTTAFNKTIGEAFANKFYFAYAVTLQEAIDYCLKGGKFEEFGVRPLTPKAKGAAGSAAWEGVVEQARAGNFDAIPPNIYVPHMRNLHAIYASASNRRVFDDTIPQTFIWFHGLAGTGKSATAKRRYPKAYTKNNTKWWDGYAYEEVVIWEEISLRKPEAMAALCQFLKTLCDNQPCWVESKGGMMRIRPRCVIVTSNYTIQGLWFEDKHQVQPLLRRFTQYEFTHVAKDLDDVRPPEIAFLEGTDGSPLTEIVIARNQVRTVRFPDEPPAVALESSAPTEEEVMEMLEFDYRKPRATTTTTTSSLTPTAALMLACDDVEEEEEEEECPKAKRRRLERKANSERRKRELQEAVPFSQKDTQELDPSGPVPLVRTKRWWPSREERSGVGGQAGEVSAAAAALLELNDGDTEPSQGDTIDERDGNNSDDVSSYAGTNCEIESEDELRYPEEEEEEEEE